MRFSDFRRDVDRRAEEYVRSRTGEMKSENLLFRFGLSHQDYALLADLDKAFIDADTDLARHSS